MNTDPVTALAQRLAKKFSESSGCYVSPESLKEIEEELVGVRAIVKIAQEIDAKLVPIRLREALAAFLKEAE